MFSLLLTLGHGSSAILVDDGKILCGFENERLTGIKGDSSFPEEAIDQIFKFHDTPEHIDVYVSHWFMAPSLVGVTNKWWNPMALKRRFNSLNVRSFNGEFTHHGAHALSATMFAGKEFTEGRDTHVLVCDGFGTYGETITLFSHSDKSFDTVMKRFGFDASLGLMYQYATAYLGLKMNQDEYKLLGYEAFIGKLKINDTQLNNAITAAAETLMKDIKKGINSDYDPMISMSALPAIAIKWNKVFDRFKLKFGVTDKEGSRILIAKLVQGIVERVVIKLLDDYKVTNLVVSGGVFMNVKLNNALAKYLVSKGGQICVMPLCGDSGAALGVYQYYNGDMVWPDDVFWGQRDLSMSNHMKSGDILIIDRCDAAKVINDYVMSDKIVNVVDGAMEFGPRALGHTSTLAKPTMDNVAYINMCNGRSTIMPMAGVCKDKDVDKFHGDVCAVHKSMEYMICTRDYICEADEVRGAAHVDPDSGKFTGRTQVVSESSNSVLYNVLSDELPMVINTSFNPHGWPILYSMFDIVKAHGHMKTLDVQDRILTVIVK